MKIRKIALAATTAFALSTPASAALVGVAGDNSNQGTAAAIISAPGNVSDDAAENSGLQGFDEMIGFLLTSDLLVDGGSIAKGTRVDSHMIFLNSKGNSLVIHNNVDWKFDGTILGTMSDVGGTLEGASNFLGNPGTIYPGAFRNRGLEGNDSISFVGALLSTSFRVTEPGDWVRVVTTSAVPLPAALPLLGSAFGVLGFAGWRRQRNKAAAA